MVQSKKPIAKKIVRSQVKKAVAVVSTDLPVATKKLLTRPEGLEVDFKRDAEAVKQDDLVAFANSGGVILVGVDESKGRNGVQNGLVVGCDVSDRECNKIVSRASQCRPAIAVKVTIETHGRLSIFRVDIPKGGLHCTPHGTYKIRRDGQTDIVEPSTMAQIIVELERKRILHYLRAAIQPELESTRADVEALYDELSSDLDNLRSEMNGNDDEDDFKETHEPYGRDHEEW
jgi:predicted HTH transcriptional regulator